MYTSITKDWRQSNEESVWDDGATFWIPFLHLLGGIWKYGAFLMGCRGGVALAFIHFRLGFPLKRTIQLFGIPTSWKPIVKCDPLESRL